jgi:RecA/RadA recombinase
MELDEIKDVGPTTAERLRDAEVTGVEGLASATVEQLTDSGLSATKTETLIERANKHGVVLQTGDEVVAEYESRDVLTTGMEAFDEMLGGGWSEDDIVGISGESSAGKTQLAFQALVAAVEETGDPAVYIETERGRYEPDRLAALASEPDTQEQIYRVKAYSLDQQLPAYEKVAEVVERVSLVVVDSFTARFRLSEKFEGRGTLTERSIEMARHLNGVERMVDELDCPVLLTLQIYGNPSAYGRSQFTYGGELLNHTLSYFIRMAKDKGSLRKARLQGHPGQSEAEVYLSIRGEELIAMQDA